MILHQLRFTGALVAATTLGACGGHSQTDLPTSPAPVSLVPPDFTAADTSSLFGSGTRLKAHVEDGGGGARVLIDFYDSELDTSCTFEETATGEYHCLPTPLVNEYFDSDCTQAAFVADPQNPPKPGMFVTAYLASCDTRVQAYSVLAKQPVTQPYGWVDGKCYPVTVFPPTAWTLQAEPLSRFASSTVSMIGEAGEAQALRITSEDGAYQNRELSAQGEPCADQTLGGTPRCLQTPLASSPLGVFASSNCKGAQLGDWTRTVSDVCAGRMPKRILVRSSNDICAQTASLFEAIPTSSSAFELSNDGSCGSYDGAPFGELLYAQGNAVDPSEAPILTTAAVGSGAVVTYATANRLGTPLLGSFGDWHLADGTPCQAEKDASGALRCFPGYGAQQIPATYADAACTDLLTQYYACDPAPEYIVQATPDGSGHSVVTSARVAEPYLGPVYFSLPGGCTRATKFVSTYYRLGATVDLDTFPVIADVTDP